MIEYMIDPLQKLLDMHLFNPANLNAEQMEGMFEPIEKKMTTYFQVYDWDDSDMWEMDKEDTIFLNLYKMMKLNYETKPLDLYIESLRLMFITSTSALNNLRSKDQSIEDIQTAKDLVNNYAHQVTGGLSF